MSYTSHIPTLVKQDSNILLCKYGIPRRVLDCSYSKQVEFLNELPRNLDEKVTSKNDAKNQESKIWDNISIPDESARLALNVEIGGLYKYAFRRKNISTQLQDLVKQITTIQMQQDRLERLEKDTLVKAIEVRARKETIKAQIYKEIHVEEKKNIAVIS